MASFYHTHQYVGVFKLIYFVIFFIFGVLSLFVLRKKCGLGKMLRFLIKFSSEFLQIFYSDSLYHTYQYGGYYKLIYIWLFFAFLYVFSVFLLRKILPGKSYQNHFKFTTWMIVSLFAPTRGAFLVLVLTEINWPRANGRVFKLPLLWIIVF